MGTKTRELYIELSPETYEMAEDLIMMELRTSDPQRPHCCVRCRVERAKTVVFGTALMLYKGRIDERALEIAKRKEIAVIEKFAKLTKDEVEL